MSRRINPRRVKIHRNYTVEEAARLLDAHKNTVRSWLKGGLSSIDQQRPTLIHGRDLVAFLETRRKQLKRTCGPGEIYCVKCREPKEPVDQKAEYIPLTTTSGNLRGTCPTCGTTIHRRVNRLKLGTLGAHLAITFPQALRHIGESLTPSLNCDSHQEDGSYADA
jgi:hypothetical protein